MKIDVCPGDDLRTLCPSERVGRSKLIQTNLTEQASLTTFHELNSLSLVRLMKSSTFGLDLFSLCYALFTSHKMFCILQMYVNRAGHILMVFVTRQAIHAKIGLKLRKPAKHIAATSSLCGIKKKTFIFSIG